MVKSRISSAVFWGIVSVFWLLWGGAIIAQTDLDETFVSPDNTWQFSYPGLWTVSYDDTQPGVAFVAGDGLSLMLVSPQALNQLGLGSITNPAELLQHAAGYYGYIITQSIILVEDAERPYATVSMTDADGQAGIGTAMTFSDGRIGFVYTSREDGDQATAQAIIASFDIKTYRPPMPEAPLKIENYAGEWQAVIGELRESEVIGAEGGLIFFENYAFYGGTGSWMSPLASSSPQTDVVMGGQLIFTLQENATRYETCGLMARVNMSAQGSTSQYVEFGIDSDGDAYYFDFDSEKPVQMFGASPVAGYHFDRPLYFLAVIQNARIVLYVDGERVFDDFGLDIRAGSYGIGLLGRTVNTRCEGRSLWAYHAPFVESRVCRVVASGNVNTREGPGLGFAVTGQLINGMVADITTRETDLSGIAWWKLKDNSWVREDVVSVEGDCRAYLGEED